MRAKRWIAVGMVALLLAVPTGAAAAGPGSVSGTVSPLAWAPEVEVCLVEERPSETCTAPRANGTYTLEGLPLGGAQIEFIPSLRSGLLTQYYNHAGSLKEADSVLLTAKEPAAKGVDADLTQGGAITGTVTAADGGAPLAGVEACALSRPGITPALKRCAQSDGAGKYELHSLPSAPYTLAFYPQGPAADYIPSYYDGAATLGTADPVAVNAPAASEGIDATLARGATIKGTLTEAGGPTLPGIAVCLFEATTTTPQRCTYTDQDGTYAFPGLPSGTYEVGFSPEGGAFEPRYYQGAATLAQASPIAAGAPSIISGIDAALTRTPAPPPPPAPPAVSNPIFAAAAFIAEPKPPKRCKQGYREKQVKGKSRCVKQKPKHKNKGKQKHKGAKR